MFSIRYSTFETNSSSTHSLAVPKKVEYIPFDVRFHFGDFGWQLEDCIDPADYLYTGIEQIVKKSERNIYQNSKKLWKEITLKLSMPITKYLAINVKMGQCIAM